MPDDDMGEIQGLPLVDQFDPGRDVLVVQIDAMDGSEPEPQIGMRRDGSAEVLTLDGADIARICSTNGSAGAAAMMDAVRLVLS